MQFVYFQSLIIEPTVFSFIEQVYDKGKRSAKILKFNLQEDQLVCPLLLLLLLSAIIKLLS